MDVEGELDVLAVEAVAVEPMVAFLDVVGLAIVAGLAVLAALDAFLRQLAAVEGIAVEAVAVEPVVAILGGAWWRSTRSTPASSSAVGCNRPANAIVTTPHVADYLSRRCTGGADGDARGMGEAGGAMAEKRAEQGGLRCA